MAYHRYPHRIEASSDSGDCPVKGGEKGDCPGKSKGKGRGKRPGKGTVCICSFILCMCDQIEGEGKGKETGKGKGNEGQDDDMSDDDPALDGSFSIWSKGMVNGKGECKGKETQGRRVYSSEWDTAY